MLSLFKNEVHHQLVTKAPKVLAMPARFMPFYAQQHCLRLLLNGLFEEAIKEGELAFLKDKWLSVTIDDLSMSWQISFTGQIIIRRDEFVADVKFSANINDLILIAGRKEDPDTLFFQRRLKIEGDTELGLEIKNLLDNIDFEQLSPFIQKLIMQASVFVQQGLQPPNSFIATVQ